jgi:hypothetical protein
MEIIHNSLPGIAATAICENLVMAEDWRSINLANWEARVPLHTGPDGYLGDAMVPGPDSRGVRPGRGTRPDAHDLDAAGLK